MPAIAPLLALLSALHVAGSAFMSPGPFQSLVIQDVSVTQTCAEEFECRSNSFDSTTCVSQGVCSAFQECNGREGLPALEHPLVSWQTSLNGQDKPGCTLVTKQPDNPPPVTFGTSNGTTLTVNGSAADLSPCFTERTEPLNSSFSLVFWLKADCRNCSVLEIIHTRGSESVHLRVVDNMLCVNSDCQLVLQQGSWTLITLRAIMNGVQIYGDNNRVNFPSAILDNMTVKNLYIGSSEIIPMADLFELYDVRFFNDAITSREIVHLNTGMFDLSPEFAECRCPGAYPDLDDSDTGLCTDGSSTTARYNTTVHFNSPDDMFDENHSTRWASSQQGTITLTLDLGRSFQIGLINATFTSALPTKIEGTFVSRGKDMETRQFTCSDQSCTIDLIQVSTPQTMQDYEELTAETIKISMYRAVPNDLKSFVVSEIDLSGRCDCQGNADSCTYDSVGGYNCACADETNTLGTNCGTCKVNFIRSSGVFGCRQGCSCNSAGVANLNDMCDQVDGICKCKANVEGTSCDTCKSFTYNLDMSNPNGCSACNCNQTGALSCSNTTGECQCRDNTVTDQCERCADDSFGFADGCQPCTCNTAGSNGTGCTEAGQCLCKDNVKGLKCDECKQGYYDLKSTNMLGCKECSCHPVGAEHSTCDTLTGQCQCWGRDVTDLACTPAVTSIEPAFGPEIGGTLVTIKGRLFGNDMSSISVLLDNVAQEVVSIDGKSIVFRTMPFNTGDSSSSTLQLRWKGVSDVTNTTFKFEYVLNPVYDMSTNTRVVTYESGGCPVDVHGSNLKNVKYPQLEFTNTASSGRVVYGACNHQGDRIRCITPNLSSILPASGSNSFEMKVMLDGVTIARDVTVLSDPTIDDPGKIKFQYPFEDTVGLSGKNLKSSCPVGVYLGVVSCEIKHLSDTGIDFAPPVSPPGGRMKHNIQVHIGETKIEAGTLQYLELYETTGFIIIVSCIAGVIVLVILLIVICCCYRRRRNHAPPSSHGPMMSNGANNKQNGEVESRPMNNYSELVTLVNAPVEPAKSNGHNSLVRMETVVKEHKRGIVNSEAEDTILAEEFLPRVEPGVRDEVKKCYIGSGHFVPGRRCFLRGQHTQLVDGTLQRNGAPVQKLIIKSIIDTLSEQNLPNWANLALSECLRLKRFKHNHIVSIIGIGANQHQFHILYPNMAQGILKAVVSDTNKDFSVRQLLGFSQQVAEGIDFLTSKDVTHKDVAARNCMIDEYSVVKLSDASFSWDLYPDEYVYDQSRERYLPIRWMAPESLLDGYYDMRTDVWSFAVLVWELLTRGCLPFHEVADSAGVSEYILQGYILGRPDTLSVDVYELLRSCWSPENESRPSIASVARTLSDILEADDDETYANAGELASFQSQHSSGLAASPRHHAGGGNIYSTTNLSRV